MTYIPKTMLRSRLRLGTVYRWSAVKMNEKQSVAEHIYYVMVLLKMLPLDNYYKTMVHTLNHEDDEAVTGMDIPSHIKNKYTPSSDLNLVINHDLSDNDYKMFKFADIMEAWLFAIEHCIEAWEEKLVILNHIAMKLTKYCDNIELYKWLDSISYKNNKLIKKVIGNEFGGVVVYLETGGKYNGRVSAVLCRCNTCKEFFIARKSDVLAMRYNSCGCLGQSRRELSTKSLKSRLLSRTSTNPVSGCWEWNGSLFETGYGRMMALGEVAAHRVSYRLYKGEIKEGQMVLHKCDNPKCVNPDHLFKGNGSDNIKDCVKKGRHSSEWQYGENHPSCKLSDMDVETIRNLNLSIYRLAEKFDVAPQTVSKIKNFVSRKKGGNK